VPTISRRFSKSRLHQERRLCSKRLKGEEAWGPNCAIFNARTRLTEQKKDSVRARRYFCKKVPVQRHRGEPGHTHRHKVPVLRYR
jgi:hypothetical protein